jgi:hypothetical protein
LSLSPVFRRRWPSAYAAIAHGRQDEAWLEEYLYQQVPLSGHQIFALDESVWPHPKAEVLTDRQNVYSSGRVVVGHAYSALAWVAEPHTSWALPLSTPRVKSSETAVEVGVRQVKALLAARRAAGASGMTVIVADGKYGNHRFLGPLREEADCAVLPRLRRDRVLYHDPGPYAGRGRPRVHGARFAFKAPETWGPPDEEARFEDPRWGQVRLRAWDRLHAREDATTPFTAIRVETHLEHPRPDRPFWIGYLGPTGFSLPQRRAWFDHRWPIEPSFRFRKQRLCWTLPAFQTSEACDRWTVLVTLAQWQLYLARNHVADRPLPWQPPQTKLTPERVKQGLAALFAQIGTPATPPQTRGKSPGWPSGRPRTLPRRHEVVRKGKKRA